MLVEPVRVLSKSRDNIVLSVVKLSHQSCIVRICRLPSFRFLSVGSSRDDEIETSRNVLGPQ